MELTPYKAILERCEAITDKTVNSIFLEANVDPANIYNWKKKESKGLLRWISILDELPPEIKEKIGPGVSTFQTIREYNDSYNKADLTFQNRGFSNTLIKAWKYEDPQYVEAYKRLLKTVTEYETRNL